MGLLSFILLALAQAPSVFGLAGPRPAALLQGVARRTFVAGLGAWSLPCLALPPNPLGLKGQFWETGSIVYVKPVAPDRDQALARILQAAAVLRASQRSVEFGDAAALLDNLARGGISERSLRLDGAAILAEDRNENTNAEARQRERAFAAVLEAWDRVEGAAAARLAPPGSEQLSGQALTVMTATGLVYLLPPAAVNAALRSSAAGKEGDGTRVDPGLLLVGAVQDCVKTLEAFTALVEQADAAKR
ncbi:hypothetical protein M885DRAFT_521550 [Pelagophyceae sp. CCMP2097]|nr:hypothetical protein M885DRAFT_521550 [Pelagophyceae sp. CCMP2097]